MADISVFISHSWHYSEHYDKLAEWIFKTPRNVEGNPLSFGDQSVPKDDPIHNAGSDEQLRQAIYSRIFDSHVVVIPTGMYTKHSKWIQKEIEGAELYNKPILAVDPWGQERKASHVSDRSDMQVGWNSKSVVDGILDLYGRGH